MSHETIISSFNMAGGYSFHKALLERSRRIGWGKNVVLQPPSIAYEAEGLSATAKARGACMGRGEGETKSGKAWLFPHVGLSIMEDSYSNYSTCFILNCDTWLIDIPAWKQMYFPQKISFQYCGSWRSILFCLTSHSGSLCDLCALNKTHIILGNISSAVTEQLFFCATWFCYIWKTEIH